MGQRLLGVLVDEHARRHEVLRDDVGRVLLQTAQVTAGLVVQLARGDALGEIGLLHVGGGHALRGAAVGTVAATALVAPVRRAPVRGAAPVAVRTRSAPVAVATRSGR